MKANMPKTVAIGLAAIIVVLLAIVVFVPAAKSPSLSEMQSAASSAAGAGASCQPPAVVSSDGHLSVSLPHPGDVVDSPVAIEGTVTGGGWFFEGSFPVEVLDSDGNVIGKGTAKALSDWTSTGTVPFAASIAFTGTRAATGTIVFRNDNPSGLPQNGQSLSVPIAF
jgi:hypothetical protein